MLRVGMLCEIVPNGRAGQAPWRVRGRRGRQDAEGPYECAGNSGPQLTSVEKRTAP